MAGSYQHILDDNGDEWTLPEPDPVDIKPMVREWARIHPQSAIEAVQNTPEFDAIVDADPRWERRSLRDQEAMLLAERGRHWRQVTQNCDTCGARGTVTAPPSDHPDDITEAEWLEGLHDEPCPDCGGSVPADGVPVEVPYERERVADLVRAIAMRPGSMAPWEQDIMRALQIQAAVRGWVWPIGGSDGE